TGVFRGYVWMEKEKRGGGARKEGVVCGEAGGGAQPLAGEPRPSGKTTTPPFPGGPNPRVPADLDAFRVLDVGAGPVTAMGDYWEGKDITIVPVDPLAEAYADLLQRYAITLPTPTIYGLGEELIEQFGKETFHFAYACNCLDHSMDPVECYRQMLGVLKPGCSLVTFHEANEAERQNYEGLHQWNFSVRESRLIVWNHNGHWDIVDHCPDAAHYHIEQDRHYIKFTLTKKA
ncbi:MAG: methyltransferase domain-containing protein, partial [Puniceicoccaceae bacterium]